MIKITSHKIITLALLFCLTLYSDDSKNQFTKAEQSVKELGADSYKARKKAVQTLISLGYHAREAVKKVLSSKDPEIKSNAQKVWQEIRWAIVPQNPKRVNAFFLKLKKKTATYKDWQELLNLCGVHSLKIIIEAQKANIDFSTEAEEKAGFDLVGNGAFDELNESPKLNLSSMLKSIVSQSDMSVLVKEINSYDKKETERVRQLLHGTINTASAYFQKTILTLASPISPASKTWTLYDEVDFSSKMIRGSLTTKELNYLNKNYKSFEIDQFYKALLILREHKVIDIKVFNSMAVSRDFSKTKLRIAKIFYSHSEKILTRQTKLKLLEQGSKLWFVFQKNKLSKKLSNKEFVQQNLELITNTGNLTDFIDDSFSMSDPQSMPFIEIAQNDDLQSEEHKVWKILSPNMVLMNHFHRTGDFDKAEKFLAKYNERQQREKDSNELFFSKQKNLIKAETRKILKKVNLLKADQHKDAIALLADAAKLNPDILTVLIQKAEWEIKAGNKKDALSALQTALPITPNNLIEIRDLVHICWDLNASELSRQFISKLSIDDDDYQNISLISQNHEFFLDMKKAEKFHTLLGLEDFGIARDLFYSKKYTDIMPLCKMPEEGDFQFLWGIMAARVSEGIKAAKIFSQHYLFEDDWAEAIGMTLAGKLTPQELINEATSPLSFGGRRGRLTEAYFYAAICYMEKGKEDFRKVHFYLDKCIKLNFRDYYEYISAKVLKKILPEPPK
jgi:tetratricopeptide (TPR) repeat protein